MQEPPVRGLLPVIKIEAKVHEDTAEERHGQETITVPEERHRHGQETIKNDVAE